MHLLALNALASLPHSTSHESTHQRVNINSEFIQAFCELDDSPKGLYLVFFGEQSHNSLVRAVKSNKF